LEPPDAWIGHTPFAYWLIQKLQPSVFVELGAHTGNSYFSFCQSIQVNKTSTKAFAVDTWTGDQHSGFYDEAVYLSMLDTNRKYESFSTLLRTTFDKASAEFEDNSVALLHIDGLHTYEAVKHDFENWLPKMASNGVILFHDTSVYRDNFGVHQLWSEISGRYHSMEFLHSNGLGVIDLSQGPSRIVPTEPDDVKEMLEVFASLGNYVSSRYNINHTKLQLDQKNTDLHAVNESYIKLSSELSALKSSISWKFTAPLRLIGRIILKTMSLKRTFRIDDNG
jgi:hypothetical protein